MDKDDGAFLTIGELARELGVAQHILRYWETRFPQLRPLQRSGNRRYYRPRDVAIAGQINRLLNVEGFTVRGAQRALAGEGKARRATEAPADGMPPVNLVTTERAPADASATAPSGVGQGDLLIAPSSASAESVGSSDLALLIARLTVIRQNLQDALEPPE